MDKIFGEFESERQRGTSKLHIRSA